MDEQSIQSIVNSVLRELGETNVGKGQITAIKSDPKKRSNNNVTATATESNNQGLEDLSLDKFIKWNGIRNAKNASINDDMIKQTAARVCQGRAGPRPRTISLLRFVADHSRSKDTVVKEVTSEWLAEHDIWEVHSRAADKSEYLTRPDLGRLLSDEGKKLVQERCKKSPQVQVVISDGLSTDAVTNNYDEILPPLLKGLESAGFNVGTPFFLRYGRVKAQDEIGELLQAEANLLLIGERPGLGQSESLSCYCVYKPTKDTVESDRMVISNIHNGGTPPIEAAAVIVDLTKKMLEQKASGLKLKR
ncbi:ethanolamine ammonia-lyase subunit EutC [Paraglaciecola arctica]|uniref:Ethanolamine ammonia-lyase small subunit n=1 Tax=Paraglaciecola arctica BSs20135 TaxID=493475 RepID=K6YZT5_9ALTE|nr:ethanolamine ammonia-lyase subunit EutC [Paraglaciecola arctica]GAC22263.1 ethanolamine ammonia-lyase small subunit [Paraglaciecola arctica BSs20135]